MRKAARICRSSFHRQPRIALSKSPTGAISTAEGTWQGAIEANGMRYRLQLHISHDSQGHLVATMDSIDQGINGFHASQATESDSQIHHSSCRRCAARTTELSTRCATR